MRVLFLSHYFPPEVNAPASRTYEHCKQWVRDGHEVTVVTCAPNHPRGKVYEGYSNRFFQREEKDEIRIIRVWTYVTANEGFFKRTLNYVSFMVSSIVAALWLPQSDVVVTTSPQFFNGLAGYFVSRLKRMPWVLEIRDLWPESILAVGAIRNKAIIRMLEWVELFAYRKADRIVPVTDAFKRYMVKKGIPAEKIEVIKNGVDLSFFKEVTGLNPIAMELGLHGKFVAAYVGTHGMAHCLETILYSARELKEREDIVILLVGDGAERQRLLGMRDEMVLHNVIMLDQQPKEKMPYLWALSDVSLVLLKKSELFTTVIPSKIFESMAMKKPIILGVEGESAGIIKAAEAGFCIEPENSHALAECVLELYRNRDLAAKLGSNGRRHVAEHYDRTVLARRYESLLASLILSSRPTASPLVDGDQQSL
ncbi:MAG: glycosyltransferase family 4 protein [Nitrospira sp.]|nr:MAG: glycosyltransferase family 4 protein [Nitrospira sp.]